MTIAFTIPVWILWAIGIPIGLLLLVFAFMGIAFMIAFKDGIWR